MPRFIITTTVNFVREIEADDYDDAKEQGYYYNNEDYESVEDVRVVELEDEWDEVYEDDEVF